MSHWKHTITGIDWSQYRLHEREAIFRQVVSDHNLHDDMEQPPLCIVWEDPDDLDAPVKITRPSPTWWAMALHGDILPPVEVYHALREDEEAPGFTRHTRGHLLHETHPISAMTPEQAIEYLIQKDIPPRVWRDYRGNRTILKIVPVHLIPSDRTYRDSWRIHQQEEAA